MTFPAKPRSWLTRGYFNASPWGRTVAPVVALTEVAFFRAAAPVKNSMGGFTDSGLPGTPYLTAMCHVDMEEATAFRSYAESGSIAPIQTRHYVILLPFDALNGDPALVPQRGDVARWLDDLGRVIETPINTTPDNPVNAQDHLELQTDEFE